MPWIDKPSPKIPQTALQNLGFCRHLGNSWYPQHSTHHPIAWVWSCQNWTVANQAYALVVRPKTGSPTLGEGACVAAQNPPVWCESDKIFLGGLANLHPDLLSRTMMVVASTPFAIQQQKPELQKDQGTLSSSAGQHSATGLCFLPQIQPHAFECFFQVSDGHIDHTLCSTPLCSTYSWTINGGSTPVPFSSKFSRAFLPINHIPTQP